jgi:hypothetical protein
LGPYPGGDCVGDHLAENAVLDQLDGSVNSKTTKISIDLFQKINHVQFSQE